MNRELVNSLHPRKHYVSCGSRGLQFDNVRGIAAQRDRFRFIKHIFSVDNMIAKGTPMWIFLFPLSSMGFLALSIRFNEFQLLFFIIGMVLLTLSFLVVSFFRDPRRRIGRGIISPADGKVMFVERCANDMKWHIAIFMGPQNVHVNRAPLSGKVLDLTHFKGSYKPAFNKESEDNERVATTLMTSIGEVRLIQIAGIVARRIIPYIARGDQLRKGQKIGIIRFGSRLEVFLPVDRAKPTVFPGEKIKAGIDTIAVVV